MTAFDHTADAGIEVRGASLAECLARAGAGLYGLMFSLPSGARASRRLSLELSADSPEALLVAWLEELLYRGEVAGLVFTEFEVEASGRHLRASLRGVPRSPSIEAAGPAVKGVTWHGLKLSRDGRGWRARVIFDV